MDCRITPQVWGGVAHATKSLLHGLASLDGDEQYVIAVSQDDEREWVAPLLGGNQRLVDSREWRASRPDGQRPNRGIGQRARSLVGRGLRRVAGQPPSYGFEWPRLPLSDGFYESLQCDVMHFPTQRYVLCSIPTVYNPHDLQHLHYPQFFRTEEIAYRDELYRRACQFARCVMVGSGWIKHDVVHSFGIDPARVQVIPEGAPTQFVRSIDSSALAAVRERLALPETFLMFPAMTWPHKNHLGVLAAMRRLRDTKGVRIRLVCTGSRYEPFWPELQRRIQEMDLESQVQFLGYVKDEDLAAVYRLAAGVIMPSLFEASSLPIFEAWHAGTPVASSTATALPEQVVDAALLFDPSSVEDMASAIDRLLTDTPLRASLVARGTTRLADFDWHVAAKAYRAVYRRAAGRSLTEEDRWLLSWSSMRDAGTRPPVSAVAHGAS